MFELGSFAEDLTCVSLHCPVRQATISLSYLVAADQSNYLASQICWAR